jgi:hypothetical protein
MTDLGGFSDAARPVFSELLGAAPAITRLTRATPAFSKATTISLKSLGDAGEVAGPNIRASDPVVLQLKKLANVAKSPSRNLKQLLFTLRKTGGFEDLMKFIYNGATTLNGFDQYGHYQRTNILISSCVQYATVPSESCQANWGAGSSRLNPASREAILKMLQRTTGQSGGTLAVPDVKDQGDATGLLPALPTGPAAPSAPKGSGQTAPGTDDAGGAPGAGAGSDSGKTSSDRGGNAVLRYLLGP